MAQNKLILRKLDSGFGAPFQDALKGSVLSHAELDGNQIFLKGELIYTAQTGNSGATIVFPQIKGTQFEVDINPAVGGADVTISGMTFDENTFDLTIIRNDGETYVENLAKLASDIFVMDGEYNPTNGTIDFTYNSGDTFSVSGFTTGMTNYYTTEARLTGSTIYFDRTDTAEAYNVDIGPIISATTLYTNPLPMPVDVGGWDDGSTFSAKTMQEMWDGLLYPYQYPSISLTHGLFTTYEVGQYLTSGDTALNYTVSNSTNIKTQPVNVGDPSTNVAGATFPIDPFELFNAGTFDINILSGTTLTAPGSRTVTVTGTNTKNETFSDTETMLWRHKIYWGTFASAIDVTLDGGVTVNPSFVEPNDTQIINADGGGSGAGNAFATSRSQTRNNFNGAGDYLFFAWPTTFKDASKEPPNPLTMFNVNALPNSAWIKVRTSSNFTNSSGHVEQYDVWMSNTRQNSPLAVVVS